MIFLKQEINRHQANRDKTKSNTTKYFIYEQSINNYCNDSYDCRRDRLQRHIR